jgi:transcriptional regulator with XRE-family HTH domain
MMAAALTPDRAKAARRLLGWSLIRMSSYCDVSDVTIERFEKGQRVDAQSVSTIRQALELGGVEFTAEQPGVRLKAPRATG